MNFSINGKLQLMAGIIIIAAGAITILLLLLSIIIKSRKKIKAAKDDFEYFKALRDTFINSYDSMVYLKDENLKYVFVNQALEDFYQKSSNEIYGIDDFALTNNEFAHKLRQTDLVVMENKTRFTHELEWEGRIYKTTKFPVRMPNGKFGVGAYINDITKDKANEIRQNKILYRHMILADVVTRSFKNSQQQLDFVLHEALKLTKSQFGYIYLYNEDEGQFTLNSWSEGMIDACTIPDKQSQYHLDKTGIWEEVAKHQKPIVVNDFEQPNPLKKGCPEGHVAIEKFMSVPVIMDEKIVAIVGLANKQSDYDDNNVYEITLLMSGVWNAVVRRETQEKLFFERNKYLQTLVSIGDGVLIVDKYGNIEMLNKVAEKLTGWSTAEAFGKSYKDIFVISHEQEGVAIGDPIEKVFATDSIQELGNYAMLTAKDGTKYCVEDSAAPIKDDKDNTDGVVLVFRDITDKKEQRKKIEFLSFHDSLTGLYNRRSFEKEMRKLDTEKNFPLSIIMGDVNGLKLTNDIFGHSFGDILLEKVAQVLQKVCRAEDIIARWGGDEYVILLPKTNLKEAEQIIARVKKEFAKEQIKSIKGSISMGAHTKQEICESIWEVLDKAEEKMYEAKTIESDNVRNVTINSIIKKLHENNPREREHSIFVSKFCRDMGRMLNLSNIDIKKVKDAGYLHDIGKIVLEPKLLKKKIRITDQEWNEIKKHPIIGYRILNSFDHTLDLTEIVLAHQERWDGSGYPKGLKGEEIPKLSRIISLAESYERKISGADNIDPISKEKAIEAIRQKAGTYFDPTLTEVFIKMIESYDK